MLGGFFEVLVHVQVQFRARSDRWLTPMASAKAGVPEALGTPAFRRLPLFTLTQLNCHGDRFPATDTERVDAGAGASLLHGVDERDQRSRAARADRVA